MAKSPVSSSTPFTVRSVTVLKTDELTPDNRKLIFSLIQTIKTHEKEQKKG
jgi:hypothetical protein